MREQYDFDEDKPVRGNLPWLGNEPCEDCPRAATGCKRHTLGMPKRVVPGAPGPDASLPCAGKWDLFDRDFVGAEAAQLCASCPFQEWCLSTAVANDEQGIWAATSYDDRRPLVKGLKVA